MLVSGADVVRIFAILGWLLVAGVAQAGPWPREEGTTFLSFALERDSEGNSHTGLYGEYGWAARRTLGFEFGHTNVGETSGLIWFQQAVGSGEGPNRFAISSGVGVIARDGDYIPLGIIGASWGRGIERLPGGGWLAVDARVRLAGKTETVAYHEGMNLIEVGYLTPETTVKLDMAIGFKPWDRTMFINQLRMEERKEEGFSAKLATSLVYDLGGPAKIELGLVTPISGSGEQAVRFGTWLEF